VVETQGGWYTYRFRNLQYVKPSAGDVLLDVPQMPQAAPSDRFITLTACSPLYSLAERIVAYGVFESFQPRAEGPPASLASVEQASPSAEGVR
ncbi:MAG: sortase, partial [Actinomycetota bacterium]|nr:sortase [Actinomycetota bacterium]